jgi:hypothetical protein
MMVAAPRLPDVTVDGTLASAWPLRWPKPGSDGSLRLRAGSEQQSRISKGWEGVGFFATGISLRRRDGDIDGECAPNEATLARAIRFAQQPRLLAQGWVMLHGSSALVEGRVHVFVAPSETGKSTLLRRLVAMGAEPLGDEVALVGHGACAVFPYQPVAGRAGLVGPLGALHLLRQGEPSSVRVPAAGALSRLLGQAMVYETDPAAAARALEVVSGLVEQVPVYETAVPNDDRAAQHVLALARGGEGA